MTVVPLEVVEPTPDKDTIEAIEGLLDRVRSGECIAVAFVEVGRDRSVATARFADNSHHLLTSGAATLAARLAMDGIK
jgi:hypothetical protein